MSDELIGQDARTIVDRLKSGQVTPHDLLDALEKRIAAVDGAVNALPTLCFDRARKNADRLMQKPVAERGQLTAQRAPTSRVSRYSKSTRLESIRPDCRISIHRH